MLFVRWRRHRFLEDAVAPTITTTAPPVPVPSSAVIDAYEGGGSGDRSPWFEYVDVGAPGQRRYKVVAFNPSGDARPSNIDCGSPP